MQMMQVSYVIILVALGFCWGLSWSVVTTFCFKVANKALGHVDGVARPIALVDLIGYLLAVAGSGAYFLVFILAIVRWTNGYPQWSSSKNVVWIGIVAAVALLRVQRRRRT
jgi:hypothetical protein